jgi:hypothetical protein
LKLHKPWLVGFNLVVKEMEEAQRAGGLSGLTAGGKLLEAPVASSRGELYRRTMCIDVSLRSIVWL